MSEEVRECNDGAIVGQRAKAENNSYLHKSKLIVTVDSAIVGKTVECFNDNGSNVELVKSFIVAGKPIMSRAL